MKKINKGAKVGLAIQAIALIIMTILVIFSQPIPDVITWIFIVGLAVAILSSWIIAFKKQSDKTRTIQSN